MRLKKPLSSWIFDLRRCRASLRLDPLRQGEEAVGQGPAGDAGRNAFIHSFKYL